ncbi:MAG: hypothetical protein KDI51_03945 [Xanthomonadales bacterium]|nr:hypothetical protein [Xanthomonadales bacterium]
MLAMLQCVIVDDASRGSVPGLTRTCPRCDRLVSDPSGGYTMLAAARHGMPAPTVALTGMPAGSKSSRQYTLTP